MLASNFYDTIKKYNKKINTVNCVLCELEREIANYVRNHPDIVLYSYDSLNEDFEHYFIYEYPNITFTLSPFKCIISYEEIIKKSNDILDIDNIKKIISELIIGTIS